MARSRWFPSFNREGTYPRRFGAAGDGVTDDTAALQRMFDLASAAVDAGDPPPHLVWPDTYAISQPLRIDGHGLTHETGRIVALQPMDRMLTISGRHQRFVGKLELRGTGSPLYSQRTVTDGVVLEDVQHTIFDGFKLDYFLRHGIRLDPLYNHTGVHFGHVYADGCGSAAGQANSQVAFPFTARQDQGGNRNPNQYTLLACDPPPDLRVGDLVAIEGFSTAPHHVLAIAPGVLTIHPWPKDRGLSAGNVVSLHGGALDLGGSNTAWQTVASVAGFRCGVLLAARGLYGPQVGRVGGQVCGAILRLGPAPEGVAQGVSVMGFYSEGTPYDVIKATRTVRRIVLGGFATYDVGRMVGVGPTSGGGRTSFDTFEGVTLLGVVDKPEDAL